MKNQVFHFVEILLVRDPFCGDEAETFHFTFKIGSASDDPRIRGGSHLLFPAGRGPPREPQLAPNVVYRGYRLPIGRQRDDESGARPSDTRSEGIIPTLELASHRGLHHQPPSGLSLSERTASPPCVLSGASSSGCPIRVRWGPASLLQDPGFSSTRLT
ncbi:hypothetical protein H920_06619 [Fukomys damarensis]|uniref:Uncharacterized protein n=1 Tax=Fukomys damarensis TaxID=885580 RepID=A0A091DP31_FUKDA|nr:hypothetical protein H920_06619 [Fukomys damarensis]